MTVERIDGLALAGGSAFGLEAGGGVQAWLRERGRGFQVRTARVPIVPGAILFDLLAGGDKNWGRFAPYRDLGYAAAADVDRGDHRLLEHDRGDAGGEPRVLGVADPHPGDIGDQVSLRHGLEPITADHFGAMAMRPACIGSASHRI